MLFNSGGSHTMIHEIALPLNVSPVLSQLGRQKMQTVAGLFETNREVQLQEIILPEFDKTKQIDGQTAHVFNSPCNYDIILGRDFLSKAGITLNFKQGYIEWLEQRIPIKPKVAWMDETTVNEYLYFFMMI